VADGLLVTGRHRGEHDQADQLRGFKQQLLVEVRIRVPGLRQDGGQVRVGGNGRGGLRALAALPPAAQHGRVDQHAEQHREHQRPARDDDKDQHPDGGSGRVARAGRQHHPAYHGSRCQETRTQS
jgi:hypothetical protein